MLDVLAKRLRGNTTVGAAVLNWPGDPIADALALRLAGALHALVLSERSVDLADVYPPKPPFDDDRLWHAIEAAIVAHGETVLGFIQRPPQTNEVARSAALASGFLTIAALTSLPLATLEIGASAGLNLHWDSFGYDLGGLDIRKAGSLPLLAPAWQGPSPPKGDVLVTERAGCDRHPIDIRSKEEILRLRAYIWPDQPDRQARLDQALAHARSSPIRIEPTDAAEWASSRLAERRNGIVTVLFHSIVWQYIAKDGQARLERIIEHAGRRADCRAPFAWLRMEPKTPKAAALHLTLWPSGKTFFLADVDYHGRWVRWHVEAAKLS